MKKKKEAGMDNIGKEAWIYGKEMLAERMTRVLNNIWNKEKI